MTRSTFTDQARDLKAVDRKVNRSKLALQEVANANNGRTLALGLGA